MMLVKAPTQVVTELCPSLLSITDWVVHRCDATFSQYASRRLSEISSSFAHATEALAMLEVRVKTFMPTVRHEIVMPSRLQSAKVFSNFICINVCMRACAFKIWLL